MVSGPSPAVARSHREQVLLRVWAHGRTAVLTETIWCCRAPACLAPGTRAPENLAPGDGRGPRGGDTSPGGGRRDGCSLAAHWPRASCCAARLRSAARVSGTLPQRTCWLSRVRERSRGAVAPGDWGPGGSGAQAALSARQTHRQRAGASGWSHRVNLRSRIRGFSILTDRQVAVHRGLTGVCRSRSV